MNAILSTARTAGIVLSFSALGYGAFKYAVNVGKMDPFAKFRDITKVDMQTGIELNQVSIQAFHQGKLVGKAKVSKVTVSQDRTNLNLADIHDGLFKGASDVKFAAHLGTWNLASQQLVLSGTARMESRDFDLRTPSAIFDRTSQHVSAPQKTEGMFFGGKMTAASFEYSGKTGDASAHLVHWQGKPPATAETQAAAQDSGTIVPRAWDIEGDYTQRKGNLTSSTNARATDGEILVYGPKVDWEKTTDVLTATGRVSYFSGKADVIADKVVIYRKEKRAYFTGNVLMLVKSKKDQDKPPVKEDVPEVKREGFDENFKLPEKQTAISAEEKKKADDLRDGKNLREYPIHLNAQEITYWYGKGSRHAIFDGSPIAKQEFPSGQWRQGTSYDGTYNGETDILNLTSQASKRQVRYRNSVGDIAQASKAEFSTKDTEKEDDEDVKFWDMSGVFTDTSGEDTRDPKAGTTSTPPAKTNTPPGATPPGSTPPPGTTPPATTPPSTPPNTVPPPTKTSG